MNSPQLIPVIREVPDQQLNPPELSPAQEREYDRNRNLAIGDIMDKMRDTRYSEFDEESFELCDKIFVIMNDSEDDKEGRINDLFFSRMMSIAKFVLDDYGWAGNQIRSKLGMTNHAVYKRE
jgi:hypothetical protein